MKVIIKKTNQIKDVSFGYAVNYLIPKDLAVKATEEDLLKLAKEKQEKDNKYQAKTKEQEELAKKINGKSIVLKVKAREGKRLFGSVGKKEILKELGLKKQQAKVLLKRPIKEIGKHTVELKIGSKKTRIKLKVSKDK